MCFALLAPLIKGVPESAALATQSTVRVRVLVHLSTQLHICPCCRVPNLTTLEDWSGPCLSHRAKLLLAGVCGEAASLIWARGPEESQGWGVKKKKQLEDVSRDIKGITPFYISAFSFVTAPV